MRGIFFWALGGGQPNNIKTSSICYQGLVAKALEAANGDLGLACDVLAVLIGKEILEVIPGYVSTEVDARLSFDTQATVAKARALLSLYESNGVDTSRILIKVAGTWEGIQAARVLEAEGVRCNITLIFDHTQAIACAQANAFLISPFVGRIYDWFCEHHPDQNWQGDNDPGVASVKGIFDTFKSHGIDTVVMGASFRTAEQIKALAGCDRLTISPALLSELAQCSEALTQELDDRNAAAAPLEAVTEAQFRWALCDNAMATDKLFEGIRLFAADQVKLENLLRQS